MTNRGKLPRELIVKVRHLAEVEQLTTTQIGERLHFTREKVAGIIRRNKIRLHRAHGDNSGTRPPGKSKRAERRRRMKEGPTAEAFLNRVAKITAPPVVQEEVGELPPADTMCDFWALTLDRCRYPYGSRTPYMFCGAAKTPREDCPYCAYHARACNSETKAMSEKTQRYYSW